MAELVLRLRERELSRTPVLNTRMTLGRDAASDVVIDNAGVSRTHAVLIFLDQQYRIRDADSQNGLTVNGKAVKDAVLAYGDVIGIGKFEIELVDTDEDFELQAGSQLKQKSAKNVVTTVQMDASAAARIQDEIAAKVAAAKSPEPTVQVATLPIAAAPKAKVLAPPARVTVPEVPARKADGIDVLRIVKLAVITTSAFIAVVAAVLWWLTSRG